MYFEYYLSSRKYLIKNSKLMTKTDIAVNLKKLLFDYEISATELALSIDIPQPTIHRIIVGKSKQPRPETIHKIASFFKIDAQTLLGSDFQSHPPVQNNSEQNNSKHVEEISIVKYDGPDLKVTEDWIVSNRNINPKSIAIRLNDSSMEPVFNKNNIIIFDPDKKPIDRSYVLVKLFKTHIIVFRQLVINGEDNFLKPLNPDLHAMPLKLLAENDLIYGVAVESRQEFLD